MRKYELILRKTKNIGQKKKRKLIRRNKSGRAAAAFLGLLITGAALFSGTEMTASAQTIYHSHSGDEQNGGDCFATPVYHIHSGDETEGGSCYETPVYHVHTGDETNGGGCYGEEIIHVHEGDSSQGGACYTPVYHSHSDSCYAEGSHTGSCPSHTEFHPYDCGTCHDWDGDGHGCDGFKVYDCGGHRYLACGKNGRITGYRFSCTLTENQVIGYAQNCGKTEETVESYELTCTKTPEDIDYYENTCGMEEGQEIYIPDPPAENTDQQNNDSGQDHSGDSGSGNSDGGSSDGGDSGSDNGGDSGQSTDNIPAASVAPSVAPTVTPAASAAPVAEEAAPVKAQKKQSASTAKPSPSVKPVEVSPSPSPTQKVTPQIIEEEKVELPVVAAQIDDAGGEPLVLKNKWAIFTPVIKVISITSGTVLLLAAIVILLFYLRKSVRIYNDNGKGTMKYLGRAAVRLTEEGYCVQITDKLEEKATTNRYCMKPDLFMIGKNNSWEIYVVKDGKKKQLYLEKSMTFTI